ncbi:CIC family chloride channel protein [Pedobacter sp. W3I1]|uniref:chloride channel protein n=1 Tax=Pedobacter sp. W3I1 TaxID=3042291 RepID=UPI002785BC6E|nr:chloride channel protein [Pedobacter sp. W3I1]MDQ0639694.1 CIC family chloride channel protein [Pedobacter sp. W3I1]
MNNTKNIIPISPALGIFGKFKIGKNKEKSSKKRLLFISVLSVGVAMGISLIAKFLVSLINLVTNISFYQRFEFGFHSPADNHLGLMVIIIPVIGGVIVGLMALYGSKAIRGHGIPEAMEQVLTNQSKIKPSIAILKPVSSAIAIGTGGPFGAEGPIIATGGALGSTLGQLFTVSSNERKIILAAGATAGMSAIFGTPLAAVFLAIELLLFEFSPRSIIPVALACITGAAGHHLLFEAGPVFPMPTLLAPSNAALGMYSLIGIVVGFASLALTKIVYFIEDAFEKIPIHWMWWPAIGGLAVGIVGYFAPHTLGVGYDNIISLLSGQLSISVILSLCIFKFISWAIALGSGTSGGTLAPLMTIGGASGAIIGYLLHSLFPGLDISISMSALVGMSAMFAGASRAYLTSILFALESTHQFNGLLPLLGACSGAYLISVFFMKNTIMTEKIARRGVHTPDSYEPDLLLKLRVSEVMDRNPVFISPSNTIAQVRRYFEKNPPQENQYAVKGPNGDCLGTVSMLDLLQPSANTEKEIMAITKPAHTHIKNNDYLKKALEIMAQGEKDFLMVFSSRDENAFEGLLSYKDVVKAYHINHEKESKIGRNLSLDRQAKKIIVRGKKMMADKRI